MRRRFQLLLSTTGPFLLVGCSWLSAVSPPGSSAPPARDSYTEELARWVNRNEADLVSAWGVPERSQRLTDGGQALQYIRTAPDGKVLCTTLFTSDIYGQIRTWSYRGSDCHAPRLGEYGTS